MNQITHYSTVVLGATAFGCAYACTHPKNTAVVESGLNLCSEFCAALRADRITEPPQTGFGKELLGELQQRGLTAKNGTVCVPAVSGVFAKQLLQSNAAVYLQCRLAEKTVQNGCFVLTLFGPNGFFKLSCNKILDTRTVSLPQTVSRQYAFCAMLAGAAGAFTPPPATAGSLQIVQGRFADEFILRLPLKKPLPLPQAAQLLTAQWQQHHKLAGGLKIATFATALEERFPAPLFWEENSSAVIPSAGFKNFLAAAEEGSKWNFAL